MYISLLCVRQKTTLHKFLKRNNEDVRMRFKTDKLWELKSKAEDSRNERATVITRGVSLSRVKRKKFKFFVLPFVFSNK